MNSKLPLLAVVPAVLAVVSWTLDAVLHHPNVALSETVAGTAALICLAILWLRPPARPAVWFLVAAFGLSIAGDLALTFRTSDTGFIVGIGFFLLAHLGFLTYAMKRVKFSWARAGIVAVPFLVLYFAVFLPSQGLRGSPALAAAVLAYLLVSCVSLAASIDVKSHSPARWIYTIGIVSLVVSDALIAFDDFLGVTSVGPWIMPLYYLCHVLVVVSVTLEYSFGISTPTFTTRTHNMGVPSVNLDHALQLAGELDDQAMLDRRAD